MRFTADGKQAVIAECARNPLCFFEGMSYRTGWRPALSAGVGADLPIMDAAAQTRKTAFTEPPRNAVYHGQMRQPFANTVRSAASTARAAAITAPAR